jgi:hypothetical protein
MGVAAFVALPAHATIYSFDIFMDGPQAGIVTPGTGLGTATYDDGVGVSPNISWSITFQDLIGTTNNAHFHGPGAPGVPAGVRLGTPFPVGVTSGVIAGTGTISAALGTELLSGLWYHNIHTSFAGGGEIRGQLVLIPEPLSVAILATGLVGLVGLRRRSRQRE